MRRIWNNINGGVTEGRNEQNVENGKGKTFQSDEEKGRNSNTDE